MQRLIGISEANPKIYDERIKLAFIKRMKAPYKEAEEALAKAEISRYEQAETKIEAEIERIRENQNNLSLLQQEVVEREERKKLAEAKIKTAKAITEAFKQVERRIYAQHIFLWIGKKYKKNINFNSVYPFRFPESSYIEKDFQHNKKDFILNLEKLDLRCQDFNVKDKNENTFDFKDKEGMFFDLYYTNFSGANLTGLDLKEVLLGRKIPSTELAYYSEPVNFMGAMLGNTDLTGADLTGVKLVAANLQYSILKKADLTEADLNGADLTGADLNGANLSKIDLENVILGEDMLMLESKIFDNKGEEKVKLIEKINRKENFTNKEKRIYGQLIDVKSLHETTGIPERVDQQLKQDKPELFKPPKEEENDKISS